MEVAPRPLVSAILIVRDEAELLRRCLTSIRDWVDEIVVVDTGSEDHTLEVAHSFGAVTDVFPWIGDFAAARNRCLDLATGEWLLYVDADEWLEPVSRDEAMAELTRYPDAAALLIWRKDRPHFSPYREYRMWRHRPDIRFHGRIHETMVPDILTVVAREERTTPETDVFRLHHDGYEGDLTRKHHRNLPLLEQRVQELPHRVYLWNHIGDIKEALGDDEGALAAWRQGISVVRRFGPVDGSDLLVYSGVGFWQVNHGIDATEVLDEAEMLAPWFKSVWWLRASNHRVQGRHAEAVPWLQQLLAVGPDTLDGVAAYHNGMFTDWAWVALADSLLVLGDRAAAAAVWAAAAAARPDRLEYRVKALALGASLA